jgi:MATE family multidrug resistance protein
MFTESPSTWRGELAATLRLAAPLALANLLQMAIYAVDVIFVARLGEDALATSTLSVSLSGLLMWAMSGLVGGAAPLIAAEIGRRRHAVREVRRTFRMGLWLAVASGACAMAVLTQGEALMRLSGQSPALARGAGAFLDILMWTTIPLVLSGHLRNTVSALGRPGIPTLIAAASVGVNALGNYALIFGHFGLPAMGLNGSALASVITGVAMLGVYCAVIAGDRRLRRYRLFGRWWRPEWTRLREMTRIGAPIALTIVAEAGLFSGAAFLMGLIGAAQLAGHTLALQIAALAFQVPYGIGQAATIRVGYHYGARDPAAIARAGWVAMAAGMGFMAVTASIMLFAPNLVLGIYVDTGAAKNAALLGFAVQFMVVAAGVPAVRRAAGGRRRRAARAAGHPRADALRAVRLLGPRARHRGRARLLHPARGTRRVDRADGRAGRGRAADAAALDPPRSSRAGTGLEHFSCLTAVDALSGPTHMALAGTLPARVPIVSST